MLAKRSRPSTLTACVKRGVGGLDVVSGRKLASGAGRQELWPCDADCLPPVPAALVARWAPVSRAAKRFPGKTNVLLAPSPRAVDFYARGKPCRLETYTLETDAPQAGRV
ncbi:hypothetical protein CCMA1212_006737 [Trichoderma ghanense]|uniref:Uncharacterized protein n=1 Tax=Trichoderma ghanense TaxID=65468 RepID=A0ABY2H1H8_9HYPO